MNCQELAEKIQSFQPAADTKDVARLCLLIANAVESVEQFENESVLSETWREMGLRVQAATDQHAAMTQDLEELAQSDPAEFTPEQVWVLIRAIKVQSQLLHLYLGEPALDV